MGHSSTQILLLNFPIDRKTSGVRVEIVKFNIKVFVWLLVITACDGLATSDTADVMKVMMLLVLDLWSDTDSSAWVPGEPERNGRK